MFEVLNMKNFAKKFNDITFTQYYYDLSLLATSLFKWENLPNNINEKWIEKYLFSSGECMFFKDPILGYMISKVNKIGVNHYDEPTDLIPVATNYSKPKQYKNGVDAVLIQNNDLSYPTIYKVKTFAYRLAEITRTQDININAMKTPLVILCSERQRLTLKNIFAQYQGNEPAIFGDKALDIEGIQVLKTDAPIVFDKLQTQKHQVMNEFLTFIGVNNANQDKKERLVDDEVQANNEEVEFFFNTMLKARERACEEINRIWNLDIKVSRRVQIQAENEELEGSETHSEGSEVA